MSINKCSNIKCPKVESIPNEFKICSQCKAVSYCSKECQYEDWKVYKINSAGYMANLRNFLQEKLTLSKNNTRDMLAGQYFSANATVSSEQFIVVKVDRKKLTAEFILNPSVIKQQKSNFTSTQLEILSSSNCFNVCIVDIETSAFDVMSSPKVKLICIFKIQISFTFIFLKCILKI